MSMDRGGSEVRRRRRVGLDQPYAPRRGVPQRPDWDPDTFGRVSERIARFIGSWKFIAWMTAFIAVWFGWNTLGPQSLRFDPYAFLFMTLLLSLQASYAAPLILLAQNRQADRDRVQYEQDRSRDERSVADTEYLVREVAELRIALGRGRHPRLRTVRAARPGRGGGPAGRARAGRAGRRAAGGGGPRAPHVASVP